MSDEIFPISHTEKVIAGQEPPISHLEKILALYGGSGSGGSGTGGTTNYNALLNKPSINGVELTGNKTLADLGIDLSKYTTTDKAISKIELVDAIPTGSTGTTTEKCLRLTFADGTTVVNVSVNDLVGSDEKQKTIVCVVDDDGTNRTSDAYTGMITWLKDKGIPMNFAICHDTIGTSGKYTVTELQDLQAKGNDILIHGNPKLTTLANETEVITEIEKALQFHTDNGLKPTNIYVYPQGLNSDGNLTATQVKEIVGRYFDYGLNVNIASMSGEYTRGLWNKVPLVDKLNIARMEVSSTKGFDANKSKIDACIENKGLLILFTHSFMSQFTSGGYDEFKKIINYLSTQDVEFLTVSKALDKVEKIVKNYDDTQVKADIAKNKSDIADLDTTKQDKTDNTLDTTDKTVVGAINEINGNALDNATDLTKHTSDTNIHITTAERTLWNTVSNKADASQIHTHSNKTVLDKITEANVKTMNDVASGIGGRNLLIGTSVEKRKDINTPTNYTTFDPYTTFNKNTLSDLGYSVGDELTLSFEWEISQNGSLSEVYGDFVLEWIGVDSNGLDGEYLGPIKKSVDTFSSSHKKGKVSLTTKITSNNILGANAVRIRIDNSVVNFKVSKMKLEKGTIATDWTPAPEDEDMPTRRVAFVGSDVKNSNGWYKVAEQTCGGFGDSNITFMVTSTFFNYNVGILQLQIRSDGSSISCRTLKWLTRIGFNVNDYVVVINGMKWILYAYQPTPQYGRIAFEILSMSSIDNKDMTWALNFKDNNTKETTTPVATVTSSDVSSVADVETWTSATLTYTDTTKTDTPGGSVLYKIKNGICFVKCNVGENITGKNVIKVSGMPPIDGSVNAMLDNDGTCVGSVWGYNGNELNIHKTNSKIGYATFSYLVLES